MRKITSLLMLLCMFVCSAFAQWSGKSIATLSTDPATTLKDGYYVIYNNGRGTFMNSEGALGQVHVTWPTSETKSGVEALASDEVLTNAQGQKAKTGYVFYVNVEDNKLSLKSGYNDFVQVLAANEGAKFVENEGFWEYAVKDGGFVFLKNPDTNTGLDCNGWSASDHTYSNVAGWNADGSQNTTGNQSWTFYEATLEDAIDITYNYYINGKLYTSQVETQELNSNVEVPAQAFLTVVDYQGTIGEEDCEITVNCTENLPFAVTTDLSNPAWQVVEMHRNGTFRVWDYVGNGVDVKVTEMSSNKEGVSDDSKLWCFTGNLIDGFKIYNKKAGTSVTLNATSGTVKVGTAAEENDVWKLKKSTVTNDPAACFTNDGSNFMNQQGGDIKYWSDPDNGSTCYFFNPSDKVLEAALVFDEIPQGAVGAYKFTEEQKSAFVAAVNAVVADPNNLNKVKALSAMIAEAKNLEKIPYADGYYRIYSAQPGLYANKKGLIFDGSTFSWGSVSNDNVDAIVKLTTDKEKVVLQNVNSNLYMQGVAGASNPNKIDNGYITLTELGLAQYQLVFGNGTMHANGHGNGTGSSGNVIGYDAGFGSASAWYIIPATELEITVGSAGYSTTYLPFDVTVPNTVKAYAVTGTSQTYATLTEMTSIPANQGAILEGEGTYTFAIAKATSDWSQNKLAGTNVNSYVNANAYVLANGAEGVALYKATLNKSENGEAGETHFLNNANKAYLPASAVPAGARFLSFDFGTETAIESIEGAENAANAVIYDLSGRRVQKAQKGLYIVNGVKVIK